MNERVLDTTPSRPLERRRTSRPAPRHRSDGKPVGDRSHIISRSLAAGDALAILVALAITELLPSGGGYSAGQDIVLGMVAIPIWVALFKVYGLYDRDVGRISHSTVDDLPHLFHALVVGSLGLWAYSSLAFRDPLELYQVLAFFGTAFVLIFTARCTVRAAVTPRFARERVVFIGNSPMREVLLRKIRRHPEYGLDPVGYLARGEELDLQTDDHIGDPLDDLEAVSRRLHVQRVIVLQNGAGVELADVVRRCTDLNLKVSVVPILAEVLGSSVEVDDLEGTSLLGMGPSELARSSRLLKRGMDLVLVTGALLIAAPVMIAAAAAIKISSRGPIFFSQERIGRKGRHFRILKFRTMVPEAESQEGELRARSSHPAWLLLDDDPRITRVGRFLRGTSIDELPQAFNVLRGDMSLVGPRPMSVADDAQVHGWGRKRLDLTPGITGLWQTLGRTAIPFEEMIHLDYLYVTNWSLWTDLRLLLRTAPAILSRRGAN